MQRLFPIHISLLACLFVLLPSLGESTQLTESLEKYKGTQVTASALMRLRPFNKYINYYSQFTFFRARHKVSPDFIRALILAESDANPQAISNKGAMGLGQIIYTTGKQAAIELSRSQFQFQNVSKNKLRNLKKSDLLDPEINILLTCYLISKYNYKFQGKLELVITAWNAGEYQKELIKGKAAPYRETQNLIGKVNSYYIDLLRKGSRFAAHKR
jgi:peptidoglycan lytic transglycosylase